MQPISTISLARQGARALMVMVMLFNHGREEEPLSSGEVNATSQPTMVPSLTSPVFNGFYPLPGCSSFFTHDYWPILILHCGADWSLH